MSISQLFPEEGPTLNLNFAGSKTLDPRITFSRTSTATYMDDSGLIKVAPADSPRFDHRYVNGQLESLGLLVEESRSNLITYSEDFRDLDTSDTWEHFAVNVDPNSTISPDGNLNATKLINTSGTVGRRVSSPRITVVSGTTYTHSVWLKAGEYTTATVFCNTTATTSNFNNLGARINLLTGQILGTVTNPIAVIPYPNGWWKVSSTFTTDENTTTTGLLSIVPNTDAGGVNSVVGDGVSGIYVWGAQVEVGTFPTSYMPTSGSQFTRNPDSVTMTGDNFSDWYNPTEGTIVLDCTPVYDNSSNQYRRLLSIHNNSGAQTDVIQFIQTEATNQVSSAIWDGSSFQTGFGKTLLSGTRYKVAFAVKENNMNASYDGSIGTDDTSATLPVMTRMDIGKYQTNSDLQTTAHFNHITYYPTRLINAQLQNLTK